MDDAESVMQSSRTMAEAIARRDVKLVASLRFVKLAGVRIDLAGGGALVSGIQHAQVRVEGQDVDDRRAFVDWFVKDGGAWKIRVAVDLPAPADQRDSHGG
jgi:hypothetical protein